VGLLAQLPPDRTGIRLMFGSEPVPGGAGAGYGSGETPVPEEVQNLLGWPAGISPTLSLKLIQGGLHRLERRLTSRPAISADSGARLHAKIYRE